MLIGVQVESLTPGKREVDAMRGGKGIDIFVLGNTLSVYYDNGQDGSPGFNDYGHIKDRNQNQQDFIRLHSSADLYELQTSRGHT